MLQHLNFFRPDTEFTFEIESSGRIHFVEILMKANSLKQQFTEASINTGICLILIYTKHMENKNIETFSGSSENCLLYRISLKMELKYLTQYCGKCYCAEKSNYQYHQFLFMAEFKIAF